MPTSAINYSKSRPKNSTKLYLNSFRAVWFGIFECASPWIPTYIHSALTNTIHKFKWSALLEKQTTNKGIPNNMNNSVWNRRDSFTIVCFPLLFFFSASSRFLPFGLVIVRHCYSCCCCRNWLLHKHYALIFYQLISLSIFSSSTQLNCHESAWAEPCPAS